MIFGYIQINTTFYKMKGDYLSFIYECLQGENGILQDETAEEMRTSFAKQVEERNNNERRVKMTDPKRWGTGRGLD